MLAINPGGLPSWFLRAGALISGNSREGLPAWVRCMRCSRRLPTWALQLLWVSQCDRLDSYSQRSTANSASAASQQHPCGSHAALERDHPRLPLTSRESKSTQQRAGISCDGRRELGRGSGSEQHIGEWRYWPRACSLLCTYPFHVGQGRAVERKAGSP